MSFKLEELDASQLYETAVIRLDAFDGAPAQLAMRPQGTDQPTLDWYTKKHVRELSKEPDTHFIGVRDTTNGELAAYGQWQRDRAADRAKAAEEGHTNVLDKYSPGSNHEAQREFWDLLDKSERDFMGDQDYWHLHLLATKKKYQRKGLARMILEWGKQQAKADGIPAYLDSTEEGRLAYDRLGFALGPEWNMDFRKYGIDHFNRQWAMLYTPV